jgi:hypothetical protein
MANAEPAAAWEIARASGDTAKARSLAAALADDARALAELAIAGWTGDKTALVGLDARLHDRPRGMETLNWAARVATRLGDTAAADRYHRWGNAVDGHSGTEAAELRVVWERVAGDAIAGSNTAFHSPYVYRRPAPADHLVPWLPRLTYR